MNHPPGSEQRDGPEYRRAAGVLWRQGPDRILVHRVGVTPTGAAADLSGPVALVWLTLDEPVTHHDIRHRLAEADLAVDDLAAEIDRLVRAGLVEVTEPAP